MNGHHYARLNTFHGPKRQLLGNHAGHAAPAWKNVPSPQDAHSTGKGKQAQLDSGSKIFLSRLPLDVKETEVEELFRKTIGPLRESFLVYNSQGYSKGMAVVSFARPGDAAIAKQKYNGKVVDGRRPLKIEIITDGTAVPGAIMGPPSTPSLLDRISIIAKPNAVNGASTSIQLRVQKGRPTQVAATVGTAISVPPRRIRQKKGPKRIKKLQAPVTIDQLDKEMEDYRAAADVSGL
ncbi:hypothetical protein H0H87_000806 [Tephrocybe sp. NHM501043]|nr:hypothetical protein H0H87_000806 [Tephrocybe sp. NHM501043]